MSTAPSCGPSPPVLTNRPLRPMPGGPPPPPPGGLNPLGGPPGRDEASPLP